MAEQEKRMTENYEITQSVRIGDREVVFGINPASDKPYFCGLYHKRFEIIQTREIYEGCVVSDNYVEIMEQFAAYVQKQCEKVRGEWAKVTVPRVRITEEMCISDDPFKSVYGKIVAVRLDMLRPEYRSADQQLMLVDGGFGASASSRGGTCFCVNLYTGKNECWQRYEIQGEVKPEFLPDWAKERAAEIRQQQEEQKRRRKQSVQER